MRILKIGALVLLVAVAGVLAFAATRPDVFRGWEAWSPWEKLDPAMKRSYSVRGSR